MTLVPVRSPSDRAAIRSAASQQLARESLPHYARRVMPETYEQPPHVLLLIEYLEALERREIQRLIVTMPPRSSKSMHVSRLLPSWWLGRAPTESVIIASYGDALATGHGRAVRDLLQHPRYPFATQLRPDVKAAGAWQTSEGGGLIAAGVGSGITGQGGHLIVLDDLISGRADAESETVRASTWAWYQDTLTPRMMRGAVIVMMGCLTGETLVTLADGAEIPIRDIRPGARVVTYDGQRLTTSTVTNWANKGADATFAIKMNSGTVVRANARHPWLAERNGTISWRRTAMLKQGDTILRAIGGNGAELYARPMAVPSRRVARAFANPTTTSTAGQLVRGRPPITLAQCDRLTSGTATASGTPSTNNYSTNKVASAPSVESRLSRRTLASAASSVLTMITSPIAFEGFSATLATSWWDMAAPPPVSPLALDTSTLVPDVILDIDDSGIEDVFDIEVAGTGTFIANGLVSHNTRWHEDDPLGRVLNSAGASDWTVLNLPYFAEADDDLGREPGEPLTVFGEVPSVERGEISAYGWSAEYQQRPTPPGGGVFKAAWMQRRYCTCGDPQRCGNKPLPNLTTNKRWVKIQTADLGGKPGVGHDPSALATWGWDGISKYIVDYWSGTAEYAELKEVVKAKSFEHRPRMLYVEDATWAAPLVSDMRAAGIRIFPVPPEGSKWTRADAVSPEFQGGMVVLPEAAPWLEKWRGELLGFPNASHDEAVDTTSLALSVLTGVPQRARTANIKEAGIPDRRTATEKMREKLRDRRRA